MSLLNDIRRDTTGISAWEKSANRDAKANASGIS
jgi:hypothetical protein